MKFTFVVAAVLGLLSVGQSAPVSGCERLIQPLEIQGREQLLGNWIFIAESTDIKGSKLLTKMFVESAWEKVTAANESDAINIFQSQKMFGRCFSLTTKLTLENSTLSMVQPLSSSGVLLNTGCPDCLVFYTKYTTERNTYSGLQLLSKRNEVTAAELEEFKKQVECLNLPPAAILDPGKGLCPDESLSQETQTTDLTSFMNNMESDIFTLLDIFSSEGGMQVLLKILSSGRAELKDN